MPNGGGSAPAGAVGIVGGSGLTGAELIRLLHGHPHLDLAWATGDSHAGSSIAELYPSLAPAVGEERFVPWSPGLAADVDLVFLALPHGASQHIAGELLEAGVAVVDLAADFRLRSAATYERWYGERHAAPELIDAFAYGLPELTRHEIRASRAVASAGCYPTAAALAITPLVRAGLVATTGAVVDAASGVSGGGRGLKLASHFTVANENFNAYGVLDHRHTPEIEQVTGTELIFTPHLAPMTRGILATCYLRPARAVTSAEVRGCLARAYTGEPFVAVLADPPSTKATWGSNAAHVWACADDRTGWVVAICALDNLVKGASGQALQCANLLLGLDEAAGLAATGVYP